MNTGKIDLITDNKFTNLTAVKLHVKSVFKLILVSLPQRLLQLLGVSTISKYFNNATVIYHSSQQRMLAHEICIRQSGCVGVCKIFLKLSVLMSFLSAYICGIL